MPGVLVVLPCERDVLANVDELQSPKMHHIDELVFNKLSELMDVNTGEIGFSSRISMNIIAENLTECMARKAIGNRVSLDRAGVRRSINRLVNVGLLERHSKKDQTNKRLKLVRVYWRDFVALCKSVKNPEVTAEVTLIDYSVKILSYIISDLHDFKKVIHNPEVTAEVICNKPNTTTEFAKQNLKDSKQVVAMDMDFKFDDEIVKQILSQYGFDYLKIDKRWTAGFVSKFWAKGLKITWREWHYKYTQKMAEYFANPALFDSLNGGALVAKPKLAGVKVLIPAVPRDDHSLVAYAAKHGFRDALVGELTKDYRRYLISERMRRLDRKEKSEGLK